MVTIENILKCGVRVLPDGSVILTSLTTGIFMVSSTTVGIAAGAAVLIAGTSVTITSPLVTIVGNLVVTGSIISATAVIGSLIASGKPTLGIGF